MKLRCRVFGHRPSPWGTRVNFDQQRLEGACRFCGIPMLRPMGEPEWRTVDE